MTKDHPPHWRQVQEESFQDHKQSSFGAQKKSTELTLLKAKMCKCKKNTSKKNQKQAKKKKRQDEKERRERISVEKGAPEIQQEDRRTKVRSKILHMMILGPITLKTHFGPIILSFVTLSHGLRYVLEKPISIKHEY